MTDPCGDGGPATAARARTAPGGIAVDPGGRIYISNEVPNGGGVNPAPARIRTFVPGGVITTFAGTGGACAPPGAVR